MYYLSDADDGRVVLVAATHLPTALALPDVLASPTQRKHRNHSLLLPRARSSEQSLVRFLTRAPLSAADFLFLFLSSAACGRTCPGQGYHPCCHRNRSIPHIPFLSQTKYFYFAIFIWSLVSVFESPRWESQSPKRVRERKR